MIKITEQPQVQPQQEVMYLTKAELFAEKWAYQEQKAYDMIWGDSGLFLK